MAEVILVDTNAWIDHLRRGDGRLRQYLLEDLVQTCDVVMGELLLGAGLPKTLVTDLRALPRLPSPSPSETRAFIERHPRIFGGAGIGWADAQIILAAAKAGAHLYTSDLPVRRVSRALGVALAGPS